MDNSKLPESLFNVDPERVRRYEIDLSKGFIKSDGPEDHACMLEALELLKRASIPSPGVLQASYCPEPLPQTKSKAGLKLLDLIDKFSFQLRSW